MTTSPRTSWDAYFLRLALAAATRSTCRRRSVGAVIVVGRQVVSTGYCGTVRGARHCDDGGCARCADPNVRSLDGYDSCACVHAEQNAVSLAARRGIATEGGVAYVTLRPCFGCLKSLVQAGIAGVGYDLHVDLPDAVEVAYRDLLEASGVTYCEVHP